MSAQAARIAKLEADVARALKMAEAAQRAAYGAHLTLTSLAAAFDAGKKVLVDAPAGDVAGLEEAIVDPMFSAWEKGTR